MIRFDSRKVNINFCRDLEIHIVIIENKFDDMDQIETWSNIMRVKDMIDKKQRVQLLNSFKWRVVGPYFCYQFYGC